MGTPLHHSQVIALCSLISHGELTANLNGLDDLGVIGSDVHRGVVTARGDDTIMVVGKQSVLQRYLVEDSTALSLTSGENPVSEHTKGSNVSNVAGNTCGLLEHHVQGDNPVGHCRGDAGEKASVLHEKSLS